jgi:hypothetical protein
MRNKGKYEKTNKEDKIVKSKLKRGNLCRKRKKKGKRWEKNVLFGGQKGELLVIFSLF